MRLCGSFGITNIVSKTKNGNNVLSGNRYNVTVAKNTFRRYLLNPSVSTFDMSKVECK
jgi:hypothetical protein